MITWFSACWFVFLFFISLHFPFSCFISPDFKSNCTFERFLVKFVPYWSWIQATALLSWYAIRKTSLEIVWMCFLETFSWSWIITPSDKRKKKIFILRSRKATSGPRSSKKNKTQKILIFLFNVFSFVYKELGKAAKVAAVPYPWCLLIEQSLLVGLTFPQS